MINSIKSNSVKNNIIVSIIIVSYFSMDDINQLLSSLEVFEQDTSVFEVIVVDNSKQNELRNYILNIKNMKVKYIASENNGFGCANNLGAQEAQGELLLFLNPDTYLFEPLLNNIIFSSNKYKDYTVFILNQLNTNLGRQISFYFFNKNGLFYSLLIKLLNKLSIFIDGFMFGSGASFVIHKKIFLEIGGFDENLFLYYEEPDLFRRLVLFNYKSKFLSKSRIVHIGSTSTNNIELKTRWGLDSEMYYYNKYNLNFIKNLRDKIKYNKFKLSIFKLVKNEQKILEISKVNKLLILELEKSVQSEHEK